MKNIKQYFANGTKDVDMEVIADPSIAVEQEEQEETVAMGKRKRVKIRISRNISKQRTCDIIENKNDLIDKTPSPLNVKVNNDVSQDGTPKSYLTGSKSCFKKGSKLTVEINRENSQSKKNILEDKTGLNEQVIDLNNCFTDNIENINDENLSNVELCDEIGSQREESNAFQVLMNRSKPIQYKVLPQQSVEDIKYKQKLDEPKELKSKCKEKLIALADKKGYSKRKIAEIEESERIEKNIEDRIRFFKNNDKNDITNEKNDDIGSSIKNKQSSGNLLNYFSSKSHLNVTNTNEKCSSTFIVKADVHRTHNSDNESAIKSIPNKMYLNKKCSKSELDLSTVDSIHIVASESLLSPLTINQDELKREKPWSLRIKLRSENNDSLNDTTDEELFSPRSRSKFHVSNKSRNSINMEENRVDIKDYNGHIKTRRRNKKKKELISKQKESNASNATKDAIVNDNNKDIDLCSKKSKKVNKRKQISDKSEKVITTINDSDSKIINENILKRKPNEKLAPLFIKRRKTDPIIVAARRSFLQSDITDVEGKNTDCKTNNNISMLPFPTISHVTQLEDKSDLIRSEINHKYKMKTERRYLPSIDIDDYKCIINYKESKTNEAVNDPVKENVNTVLSEIEKLCPDVRGIWKALTIKDDLEKRSPPRMRSRKAKLLERKKKAENFENKEALAHDCAWTCKYKPKSAQEIVGNEEAANKLKSWLSSWSLTKENDGSSGDEFYSSDCSSMYNNENNQIAVLLGPHGSGKSASVYAIAEELGYSVLEMNASSKRTGKIILKELEEATKSHRIKKKKHTSPFERVVNKSETPKISENSLILLEDVDLIFEEDEGFVSAAYQLASNTKRPIVMTCRDICPHLSKMAPQQKKIYFQQVNFVNGSRASALLELISLAEKGYRLPHNCLMKLLQMGDLRQALLQLQYLLLSGPPILSEQSTIVKPFWQDMQSYLYKPAIKLNRKQKTKKSTNTKKTNNTACVLNNLADKLDGLSLVSFLIDIKDSALNITEKNTQPSLSLAENVSFYSASRDLNVKIANFIIDQILYKDSNVNEIVQNQTNIIVRKQLNEAVDLALSHITSSCLDRQIMALDYLPTARTICRAEESRCTANYKRGNRFFHYMHSLKVPTLLMKPNILTAACRMLQEKVDKNAFMS